MIKIRCPEDRLMDVAEVLRLKLRTREGKRNRSRPPLFTIYSRAKS